MIVTHEHISDTCHKIVMGDQSLWFHDSGLIAYLKTGLDIVIRTSDGTSEMDDDLDLIDSDASKRVELAEFKTIMGVD